MGVCLGAISSIISSILANIERYVEFPSISENAFEIAKDNDPTPFPFSSFVSKSSLVQPHSLFVIKIAMKYKNRGLPLSDLIQEGNIGLMQAVRKFDPYKNVKFSYYASFWIKAYILKFIMDNWRLVKIGTTQGQRKLFFKLKKEKQKLIEQGFEPKPKLLSQRLGVSDREIIDMDQRLYGWDV